MYIQNSSNVIKPFLSTSHISKTSGINDVSNKSTIIVFSISSLSSFPSPSSSFSSNILLIVANSSSERWRGWGFSLKKKKKTF